MDMVTDMKSNLSPKKISPYVLLLLTFSTATIAQQANVPGSVSAGSDIGASQGDATGGRAWTIRPRVTLTETLTDNANVNQSGRQTDLITEISPGIRIDMRTARLKGYFDYALSGQFYARSDYSRTQNSLNTFGTLEAIDNWFFVDFSGRIAQQAISAFGPQSASNTTINSNSAETSSYRVSPYIRGQLLTGAVNYSLRYNYTTTSSDAVASSDTTLSQWIGQLQGGTPFQQLKWTLDANQQTADYSRGRKTDSDLYRMMLTYTLLPQFRVSLSGGWEANNYASVQTKGKTTHGYGFDWSPTPRTQLTAFRERRFFGDGHDITFTHRFPLSSIRFTDNRNISVFPDQFGVTGRGTLYDFYYQQLSNSEPYASISDPATKNTVVDAAVNLLLAATGRDPNTQVVSSFLSSQATVQRRQQLAFTLQGVRNSLTLMATRGESQALMSTTGISDDFTKNSLNSIEQRGVSLNITHRLSEITNMSFLASRQESTGSGSTNNIKTTTTTYQVNVSTKLGAKTTGSLSARRSEFDSSTSPYTENALVGMLNYTY